MTQNDKWLVARTRGAVINVGDQIEITYPSHPTASPWATVTRGHTEIEAVAPPLRIPVDYAVIGDQGIVFEVNSIPGASQGEFEIRFA